MKLVKKRLEEEEKKSFSLDTMIKLHQGLIDAEVKPLTYKGSFEKYIVRKNNG